MKLLFDFYYKKIENEHRSELDDNASITVENNLKKALFD